MCTTVIKLGHVEFALRVDRLGSRSHQFYLSQIGHSDPISAQIFVELSKMGPNSKFLFSQFSVKFAIGDRTSHSVNPEMNTTDYRWIVIYALDVSPERLLRAAGVEHRRRACAAHRSAQQLPQGLYAHQSSAAQHPPQADDGLRHVLKLSPGACRPRGQATVTDLVIRSSVLRH